MSLSTFFSQLRYGSYKHSSKAAIYEKIARAYFVLPQYVYSIAHGKKVKTRDDRCIFEELRTMGIIKKHE